MENKTTVIKHTYLEMVQVALLTLNESGGSSRQEMWKFVENRFPEANRKQYILKLKGILHKGGAVIQGKNKQRFKLEKKFLMRA